MNQRQIILFIATIVCSSACQSQASPPPYSPSPPDQPSPVPSLPPPASPTIEIFDTPTFSPTLTAIPALNHEQGVYLVNLYMLDESNGWGIEASGHIVHTDDGAGTWTDVTPPQGAYNDAGFFAMDGRTAWATPHAGDDCLEPPCLSTQTYVWSTQDGGTTWRPSEAICLSVDCHEEGASNLTGLYPFDPRALKFIDRDHGWLLINLAFLMNQDRYDIFYTQDGGASWSYVNSSNGTAAPLSYFVTDIAPLDRQKILVTTDEIMGPWAELNNNLQYYELSDEGRTWNEEVQVFSLPTAPIADPLWPDLDCGTLDAESIPPLVVDLDQECSFADAANNIHAYYEIHFHSTDAGRTWQYWQKTGDVDFLDAQTGWRLVSLGETSHELQGTDDGGKSWSKIKTVEWNGFLSFVNQDVGWALAYQENVMAVVKTMDGGKTWEIKTQAEAVATPSP